MDLGVQSINIVFFLDPSNGNDAGEYRWDDYWCSTAKPKPLCNAPSEICYDEQWHIVQGMEGDWTFTKKPCEVRKSVIEKESIGIIGNKQYYNSGGLLVIDMMYVINNVG